MNKQELFHFPRTRSDFLSELLSDDKPLRQIRFSIFRVSEYDELSVIDEYNFYTPIIRLENQNAHTDKTLSNKKLRSNEMYTSQGTDLRQSVWSINQFVPTLNRTQRRKPPNFDFYASRISLISWEIRQIQLMKVEEQITCLHGYPAT